MNLTNMLILVRSLLSEPVAHYWTDAELTTYINNGKDDFCSRTKILERIHSLSAVQYQEAYSLPTTAKAGIKMVEFVKNNTVYRLRGDFLKKFQDRTVRTPSSSPESYCLWDDDTIRISPRINAAAPATTLSVAITSTTATTIDLAAVTNFPRKGRVIIDNEVIIYDYLDSTGLQIEVCTRGAEGTTAATHTKDTAITLRNIYVYTNDIEADLSGSGTPEIPIQFHIAYAFYAAYLARQKSKDWDLSAKHKQEYDVIVNDAILYVKSGRWRGRVYTA